MKMKKMRTRILASVLALCPMLGLAATGDSEATAEKISTASIVSGGAFAKNFTLMKTSTAMGGERFVYYFMVDLKFLQDYTFWIGTAGLKAFEVYAYNDEQVMTFDTRASSHASVTTDRDGTTRRATLSGTGMSGWWTTDTGAKTYNKSNNTLTFIIKIEGSAATSFRLYAQQKVVPDPYVPPQGTESDPIILGAVTTSVQQRAATYGVCYYQADLQAGHQYKFGTVGGKAAGANTIEVWARANKADKPVEKRMGAVAVANPTYYEVPTNSTTYIIKLASTEASPSLSLTYVDVTPDVFGRLAPVLTDEASASPSGIDVAGTGPAEFADDELVRWYDIPVRAGLTYRFSTTQSGSAPRLAFVDSDEKPVSVTSAGDVRSFTATANAVCSVYVVPAAGSTTASYNLHAVAYAADAQNWGWLTAVPRPADVTPFQWRITSGTSGSEPWYAVGDVIPLPAGPVGVTGSAVGGYGTPVECVGAVVAGKTNCVTVSYSDAYDPGDDVKGGATSLVFEHGATKSVLGRTLWANPLDSADWFAFDAVAGNNYTIRLSPGEGSGALALLLLDANGGRIPTSDAVKVSHLATQSGKLYLKVVHSDETSPEDGTYSLDYSVTEMGSVGFAETMVSATSLSEAVELTVRRKATHADGRVRVRWGTCEGTALNGTDYFAASGEIEWAPGDSADKTIRVPLCLRADAAASRQFRVRLAPVPETDLKPDEHIPVVVDDIATVTISAGGTPGKTGTVACSSQTKWWGANVLSTDASGKKTVKVYPGDVAAIRVARTGGTSGKIGVRAEAVAGTAELGTHFFGSAETTLYWADGHAEEKLVYFGTSASEADVKSFTVRLTPVDASGKSIPGAAISTVTVQITKQGTTPAEAETETISEAYASTFGGILKADDFPESGRGGFVYYEGSPLQGSGGLYIDGSKCSAKNWTVNGNKIYTLTGTWNETVCGVSKTQTLKLVVDNGSIGKLSNDMYEYGTAEATLWCADENGLPVQRHFSGGIFRVDSNMSNLLAYQGALSPFVGSYTIGLGGDGLTPSGEPGGNGFLTLGLAADGGVTLTGRAGDGTELGLFDSVTHRAQVLVDYTDAASAEVRIPVYNVTSAYALGGVIRLVLENGVPVVKWENESDCVFYECLAQGKTSDDAPYSRSFVPHGGLWESAGKVFLLGGKKTFALVGDAQDRFDENLDWAIADSGRVSGTLGGVAYEGVMLMNMSAASRQELGGAAAIGYLSAPAGAGWTATESLLLKTEPMPTVPEDWKFPTEVSFNGNGNDTGAPPLPMTAPSGSPILLPKQSDGRDGFGKEGKVLVAWTNADGQEYKAGSAYLVPALPVTLKAVWGDPPAGVELRLSYDGELFPAGILVSNLTQNAEVEGNPFLAQPGDVLQFTLASTNTMPVYSAAFGGEPLAAGAYGVFSMTVGATGGDVTFGSTDASGMPDDPVAQRQAREALVESVTVPAPGKTLEETKVAVGGQVDAILADQPGVRPSEVAAWIQAGGFTGAQVATAREIALSYGLGADSLFTEDPVGEVSAFEPSGSQPDAGVAYDLVFSVKDGEAGEAVTVAATARAKSFAEKLVKATSDLSDWSGSSAIAAQVEAAYDAATKSVRVRVALPAGLSGAFLKIAR